MPYTIDQLDNAMCEIAGARFVRPGDLGWTRPHAMITVASRAFIDHRPEDEHTTILREALLDLEKAGCLKPSDGIWPHHDPV